MSELKKIKRIIIISEQGVSIYYADKEREILKEYYTNDCSEPEILECYRVYKNGYLETEIRATRNLIIEYDV